MKTSFRLFVMMVLQLAIWGAWAPKIFPYMGMLGFAPWQQSLVGSAWGVAALVGIFFSNQFADRNFSAERFLAVSHLIGGLALVGTAFATDFWPFFACYLIFSLVYVPTLSVTNSIAFANLKDPAADFGAVRMGGTVGWVLVSWPFIFLLGAHATAEQVRWIFLVAAIVSFVFAGYSLTLPHTPARKDAPGIDNLAWRRAFKLLAAPFVLVLFLVTFIDSVIHNGYFVMADAFLTNRVGIAGNLSMVVLSLGQVAEILTMFLLGRVLARAGLEDHHDRRRAGPRRALRGLRLLRRQHPGDRGRAAAARDLLRLLLRHRVHLRGRGVPQGRPLQRAGPVQPADPGCRQCRRPASCSPP
jgi:predicted MFS family arabinose efflux permease